MYLLRLCVKKIKLESEDIAHLVELYPDIAEIGIPTICGLPQGTVSQQVLPQLCFYCHTSSHARILHAEEAIDGSWKKL